MCLSVVMPSGRGNSTPPYFPETIFQVPTSSPPPLGSSAPAAAVIIASPRMVALYAAESIKILAIVDSPISCFGTSYPVPLANNRECPDGMQLVQDKWERRAKRGWILAVVRSQAGSVARG